MQRKMNVDNQTVKSLTLRRRRVIQIVQNLANDDCHNLDRIGQALSPTQHFAMIWTLPVRNDGLNGRCHLRMWTIVI